MGRQRVVGAKIQFGLENTEDVAQRARAGLDLRAAHGLARRAEQLDDDRRWRCLFESAYARRAFARLIVTRPSGGDRKGSFEQLCSRLFLGLTVLVVSGVFSLAEAQFGNGETVEKVGLSLRGRHSNHLNVRRFSGLALLGRFLRDHCWRPQHNGRLESEQLNL